MYTIADSSNPAIPFEAWMQTASEKGYILFMFVKKTNFQSEKCAFNSDTNRLNP
jgi:hypothetical protein